MLEDVECPYCETYNEINHDDGYGYSESEAYEQSCCNCKNVFVYYTSISFDYKANKAPCKNDGEHNLEDIHGYPKEAFVGKKRCSYCDEEVLVDPEANKEAMEKYFKYLETLK